MPFGLLDFYSNIRSFEICISRSNRDEAIDFYEFLRLSLYCQGISPFFSPFTLNHSINSIAGINSRDSGIAGVHEGITSVNSSVEVEQFELHLNQHVIFDTEEISQLLLERAANDVPTWEKIASNNPAVNNALMALQSSPFIYPQEQAIMHLWTGIESLFPEVNHELVFRISLYLAHLLEGPDRYAAYKRVKTAYNIRSKIAHGAPLKLSGQEWEGAWRLTTDVFKAIRILDGMPKEEEILRKILG